MKFAIVCSPETRRSLAEAGCESPARLFEKSLSDARVEIGPHRKARGAARPILFERSLIRVEDAEEATVPSGFTILVRPLDELSEIEVEAANRAAVSFYLALGHRFDVSFVYGAATENAVTGGHRVKRRNVVRLVRDTQEAKAA